MSETRKSQEQRILDYFETADLRLAEVLLIASSKIVADRRPIIEAVPEKPKAPRKPRTPRASQPTAPAAAAEPF